MGGAVSVSFSVFLGIEVDTVNPKTSGNKLGFKKVTYDT
jgi:hypothetical protein